MRTIHRSCHRCPFPKPPPLLQATAVTPPGRKPIFPIPWFETRYSIYLVYLIHLGPLASIYLAVLATLSVAALLQNVAA